MLENGFVHTMNTVNRKFDYPTPDLSSASILVTGGTGSFGQAFVRQLLKVSPPRRLVIFSRDEHKQEVMARELNSECPEVSDRLRFFIGDVRDVSRLNLAMRGVDIIVHAAALKIIPIAEYNPFECIMTNVHGAENIVSAALGANVQKVIALSTDKAVNPINLYGASKLAADKIMIAANNLSGTDGARFSVVRYGNVLGSRGSVIPVFEKAIKDSATDLPITDPRMTRFWISLKQGVAFVVSSLALMTGGEIFVPKIPSMRVIDIAKIIAPNLPHRIIGIRHGEKLHEIMIGEDDAPMTVELDDRYVIIPPLRNWSSAHLDILGARPVGEGFRYSSEHNQEWLKESDLAQFIAGKP
jgi:UDP-N-acetylglucosamine 4,6-dehydratase